MEAPPVFWLYMSFIISMNVVILSAYFPHFDLVLMVIVFKNIVTPILVVSVCFHGYSNHPAQICPPREYQWTSDDSCLQFCFWVATIGSTASLCAEWTKRNPDRVQYIDFTYVVVYCVGEMIIVLFHQKWNILLEFIGLPSAVRKLRKEGITAFLRNMKRTEKENWIVTL